MKSIQLPKYPYILAHLVSLLFIYTVCRVIFLIYNFDSFDNLDFKQISIIALGGVRFDLTAILYLNTFYFLLVAIPLPFRFENTLLWRAIALVYFVIVNSIGIIANIIDTLYYPFSLHRSTFSIFESFKSEGNLAAIAFSSFFDFWPITLCLIALLGFFIWTIKFIQLKKSKFTALIHYPLSIVLIFPLLIVCVLGMRGGFGSHTRPIAMNNAGQYVSNAAQMSIVLNTPFTILRTIDQDTFTQYNFFENDEVLNTQFDPRHIKNPDHVNPTENQQNVVILILESFGSETQGFFNGHLDNGTYQGLTPFLDTLMQDSLTFKYSFAHGRKSIDAIPSVVAGIPSMKVPYVISHYGTNEIKGLGSILAEQNYHTSFFHGAPNGSMGFNSIMSLAGFKNYYGMDEFYDSKMYEGDRYDGTWGIWDEEFMQYMAQTINTFEQPFVSSFFSLSSHHPNVVPKRYEGTYTEGPTTGNDTFQYADNALKLFFQSAKKMDWFENTLFVIVADHATVTYNAEYKNAIGNQRVPIVFYKPDASLKQISNVVAQQADIFPTVLDIIGVDSNYLAYGKSLIDKQNPKFAVSYVNDQYQLVKGEWMLHFDGEQVNALYQYQDDILLSNNLVNDTNEEVVDKKQELELFIKAYLQQYNNRMIEDRLTVEE
ncbi:MAG: sulfatase-like hydrolase/transferase [Saccharospirillaceae bacterium]|nr:sulfatase-like hydrolase/transferase [Pseudomonadales bacterium]NRB77557.1 sulfatase-like hydrolase/transferase [Saccharospirillaceae bacterium]